jgi:hypothetical protein
MAQVYALDVLHELTEPIERGYADQPGIGHQIATFNRDRCSVLSEDAPVSGAAAHSKRPHLRLISNRRRIFQLFGEARAEAGSAPRDARSPGRSLIGYRVEASRRERCPDSACGDGPATVVFPAPRA